MATVTVAGQTINSKELSAESKKRLGITDEIKPYKPVYKKPVTRREHKHKRKSKSVLEYAFESIIDRLLGSK